ncbi:alpha/beta fold hydrolase [Mycoplasma sp. 005V]|uniref:alpha/beta fold hydrolase n=1 Tax=Mycoplasma sp. 005V TaxID=3398776 RepID=UPI003A87117C
MEEIMLTAQDGYQLSLRLYEVPNPKGYVQLIHGMEEHQGRLSHLVNKLNLAGYTVLTSDMRGHGPNAPIHGYFAAKDGDKLLLEDYKLITKWFMKRFNQTKIIIYGFSLGTLIIRNLLKTESKHYKKVILAGYPPYRKAIPLGIALTKFLQSVKGAEAYSPLMNVLSFASYNWKIKNPKTPIDWVSKNSQNIEDYLEDKNCGQGFRVAGFKDVFKLMQGIKSTNGYQNINNCPILLIRGADDPVTYGYKGAKWSKTQLKNAGFTNLEAIDYPNCRHDIIHEEIKDYVIQDIIDFLNK